MWVKEREKNRRGGGKERQCGGRKRQTLPVCLREEGSGREIRESLKWDSKDRSAQIDIAITKKAIPQLGIHLHTLERGCSPATVSLRLARRRLIHKRSTRKGHHWAVTAHTLTMKSPSIVHVAHTTRERNPSCWQGKNENKLPKRKAEVYLHIQTCCAQKKEWSASPR